MIMDERILNKEQIMKILPHRPPLLLADVCYFFSKEREAEPDENIAEVLTAVDHFAQTAFYVDPEMDVFKGHFPDDPTFPGIYTTEAMAQCADLLLLSIPENAGATPYLSSVEHMRYLKPVRPGNILFCEATVIRKLPDTVTTGSGRVRTRSQDLDLYDCRVTAYVYEGDADLKGVLELEKPLDPEVRQMKAATGILTLCLKYPAE